MRRAAVIAALASACGHPAPPPGPVTPITPPAPVAAPVDAAPPSQDEILAAIQKAMTDLDGVARQCWASAAVVRFDIEGALEARIDIGDGAARVDIVTDTTRTPALTACMTKVLVAYPWAPPLRGQTIQLPFRFRAVDGQSVVDRALVPAVAQGGVAVSVLLDEANTGNEAASMLEVALAAGARTGARSDERAELWYFLTPATVDGAAVAAGDMMFVPPTASRDVAAASGDARAVVVLTPGGREGTARAGALPTRDAAPRKGAPAPVILPASAARTYGPIALAAEPATIHSAALSGEVLSLPAGAAVAEHVHAKETELLYVLAGAGTLTVNGVALPVGPTSVVQIPAGAKHAFAVTAAFRAVQVYTPAGPEQRFKAGSAPARAP